MTDFRLRQKFRGRATPYRLRELTGNVSPPNVVDTLMPLATPAECTCG